MSTRILPSTGSRPERDRLAKATVRGIERELRLRVALWKFRRFVRAHAVESLLLLAAAAVAFMATGLIER